ncbi:MAG: hypothetical protein Q9225_002310 [Loekoesia sp. 1 TL-2023]
MALALQETRRDPHQLARFMRDAMVTVTYFPPTQFALLLEHNAEDLAECTNWRLALFAGEYLPVRLVRGIYELQTPVTVYNQWGPTETTAQTTSHKISFPGPAEINLPVGFPMANCSHYVVDRRLRPVPASVTGELCIGGAQVSGGYLNRPEASDEVFRTNPFASAIFRAQGWDTIYKTGDLGRFLADGQIDFKGRISGDKQIKLRGHRIDLAEIENEIFFAAQQIEGQKLVNVAVLARNVAEDDSDLTDNRSLIAFVVLSRACAPGEQQIFVNSMHNILITALNDYMLPSGYQFMNTLSSLVSEKIDRQMLLKTDLNLIFPTRITELGEHGSKGDQQLLASIIKAFKDVLKLAHDREVTPLDNFFELGGHSVLMLRLRATLKRRLEVDMPLSLLFENPTPFGIAQKLLGSPDNDEGAASETMSDMAVVDWDKEATLPSDTRYHPQSGNRRLPRSQITDILLTGVDSFVGTYMLAALLSAYPSATIYVLGSQVQLISFDVSSSLERWKLFNDSVTGDTLDERVRFVPGTLALTNFGLDEVAFQHLGRSVQAIYHVGGHVSLLKSYTDLRRLNVGSVLDIIDLARHGSSSTEIHYLSTWSVSHLQSWSTSIRTRQAIDTTETGPTHYKPGGGDELGYFKSRWVAEMLLNQAANRGFPVSIYRASAITSAMATNGMTPYEDLTQNLFLGMINLGIVPDLGNLGPQFSIDLIPVDYLTSLMAQISRSDASMTEENLRYYHIGNPAPLELSALPNLISKIRMDGLAGTTVSMPEWVLQTRDRAGDQDQAQLELSVFKQFLELGHIMFSLDSKGTKEALKKVKEAGGVVSECPPVDEMYLRKLLLDRSASG